MARFRRFLAAWVAALMLLALAQPVHAGSGTGDPWYQDVSSNNWAYTYIRSLWEEGLTDGWVNRTIPWYPRSYFYPSDEISRAEYAMLLAKTFGLPPDTESPPVFGDVPTTYQLYQNKPAYGYIQAAARAGIALGDAGRFYPEHHISRQEAIAMLVRALDLSPVAAAMPQQEVLQQLRRFWDGLSVDPSLRREVATAIKLKILLGYPDGSIKPTGRLARAEAVTILYRSALIRAVAAPNPFSPDGDGQDETTAIALTTLKNGNARSWRVVISLYDERSTLRTFSGTGAAPPAVVWDGRNWAGQTLGPGTYYYRPYLTDRNGEVLAGVMKPITIESKRLTASLRPSLATPGQSVTVDADTAGRATAVDAGFGSADGPGAVPLHPQGPVSQDTNHWTGTLRVPADAPSGATYVFVRARFGSATRQVALSLFVYRLVWLEARAVPDQLRAGDTLLFLADSDPGMERVAATWPAGQTFSLVLTGTGHWQALWQIPPGTPAGAYDVLVRGWEQSQTAQTTVRVQVEQSQPEIETFLAD